MPDNYALGRAYLSATRLNLQHFIWRETLDYLLHPSIPTTADSLKVADIGAGTGIWLLHLARQLSSSAQLDGFDISAGQYPQKELLPTNLSLQTLDAMEDPPENLQGKYDVVHIQLFLIVIDDNNPTKLLSHALKLLEPGGYLQWEEHDPSRSEIATTIIPGPTESILKMRQLALGTKPFQWVENLPKTFTEHGVELVTLETLREPRELAAMSGALGCVLGEEYSFNFLDKKGPPGSGDKLRQLCDSAYTEVLQGSTISKIYQVVVGRKPL